MLGDDKVGLNSKNYVNIELEKLDNLIKTLKQVKEILQKLVREGRYYG